MFCIECDLYNNNNYVWGEKSMASIFEQEHPLEKIV